MRNLSSLASRFIPLTPAYIFTYIRFGLLHFMFVAMFRTPQTPYLDPSISCVNEVFRSPTSTTIYSELGGLLAMCIYHNITVIAVVKVNINLQLYLVTSVHQSVNITPSRSIECPYQKIEMKIRPWLK